MRSVIPIIIGFAILFAISISASYSINKASAVLVSELDATEKLVHSEQWDQAVVMIEETQFKWSEYKNWWAIFLNHSTLTSIEISLNRLHQFTITKDRGLCLAELQTWSVLFKDIPQSELLTIYNIL